MPNIPIDKAQLISTEDKLYSLDGKEASLEDVVKKKVDEALVPSSPVPVFIEEQTGPFARQRQK